MTQFRAQAEPELPHGGAQAIALAPYIGQWVALRPPTEVVFVGASPEEVLNWLAHRGPSADYGMFRVPTDPTLAAGAAPI
jgi:hypothetical protein